MVKTMAFFNPEKFTNEAVAKLKTELSDKAIIAASEVLILQLQQY